MEDVLINSVTKTVCGDGVEAGAASAAMLSALPMAPKFPVATKKLLV